jgi:hypothetical protein
MSYKSGHDFAFSSVNIVIKNIEVFSNKVMDRLLGCAVIMLATLKSVCIEVNDRYAVGKAASNRL